MSAYALDLGGHASEPRAYNAHSSFQPTAFYDARKTRADAWFIRPELITCRFAQGKDVRRAADEERTRIRPAPVFGVAQEVAGTG